MRWFIEGHPYRRAWLRAHAGVSHDAADALIRWVGRVTWFSIGLALGWWI